MQVRLALSHLFFQADHGAVHFCNAGMERVEFVLRHLRAARGDILGKFRLAAIGFGQQPRLAQDQTVQCH